MTIVTENTSVIEEEISNIVVELYDNISLYQANQDLPQVHGFIDSYIKRVTRIGFRLAKSKFSGLRDSCVIFHEILDTLNKNNTIITGEHLQQFEVWPTLILSYITEPENVNNIENLLNFLQQPVWNYQIDQGDLSQLKDAFYKNVTAPEAG
ncbi:MAG: hypothetical protein OQK75_04255, partial [Gammaproteobacteria bacterium]|nr:hypothetical protein [Gammaproteobacteria bacterium]